MTTTPATDPVITPDPRRFWTRRRTLRWSIAIALIILLYTLAGFFLVPWLIKGPILARLNRQLNGQATLASAEFNPYRLALRLQGLDVRDTAGRQLLGFDHFHANAQLLDTIIKPGYRFSILTLDGLKLHAEIARDGSINLDTLLKPTPPSTAPAKPRRGQRIPAIFVERCGLDNATIRFTDNTLPEPFDATWQGLSINLDGLDTRPTQDNPKTVTATTDRGETLTWKGTLRADPLTAKGTLTLANIDLPQFMPYLAKATSARLAAGNLDLELTYDFAPAATPRVARLTLPKVTLRNLKSAQPDGPLADVDQLAITGITADADARALTIASLDITAPALAVRRDPAGVISLAQLVPPAAPAASTAAPAPRRSPPPVPLKRDGTPEPDPVGDLLRALDRLQTDAQQPWTIALDALAITSGKVAFADRAARQPVDLALTDLALTAGPIRSAEGFKLPFNLQTTIDTTGRATITGLVDPSATAAELTIDAYAIPIAALGAYVPPIEINTAPPAAIASGNVAAKGAMRAAIANDQPSLAWTGRAALDNFALAPVTGGAPILTIQSLAATGNADVPDNTRLAWKGRVELAGVSALDLAPQAPKLTLQAAAIDGDLTRTNSTLGWNGTIELTAADAALDPAQGPSRLALGNLTLTGAAALNQTQPNSSPEATFAGDLKLGAIAIDAAEPTPGTITVAQLALSQLEIKDTGQTMAIARIEVDRPELRLRVPLLPTPASGPTPPNPATPTTTTATPATTTSSPQLASLPTIRIGELALAAGLIELTDPVSTPPAQLRITDLKLDATNLATDAQAPADLRIESRLGETGQLRVTGKIDPFQTMPNADLKLALQGAALKPFDPFTGRYVGYLVDSGRLDLDLPLTITDGEVKGILGFNLDRFYLGQSVPSPDAPSVPIKLGLDILRDSKEQITGSIPFSGNMNDPKFSLGGLIWQAFLELIVKAATAPFQILGKVFGAAEGQDLSVIPFTPGTADLDTEGLARIDILAKGLASRPALKVKVAGQVSLAADGPTLQRAILRETLIAELRTPNPTPDRLARQLRAAYLKAFPDRPRDQPEPTTDEMEAALAPTIEIPPERLAALARQRGARVIDALVREHAIDAARLSDNTPETSAADAKSSAAVLELH